MGSDANSEANWVYGPYGPRFQDPYENWLYAGNHQWTTPQEAEFMEMQARGDAARAGLFASELRWVSSTPNPLASSTDPGLSIAAVTVRPGDKVELVWTEHGWKTNGVEEADKTISDVHIEVNGQRINPFKYIPGLLEDGAVFEVDFTDPGYGYKSYDWIQSVSVVGKTEHQSGSKLRHSHIDGPRYKNNKLIYSPFIYDPNKSTTEFTDHAHGDSFFYAQVTLVGIASDGSITALGSYSWGYFIGRSGNPNFIGPIFSLIPNAFQQNIIKKYNSNLSN